MMPDNLILVRHGQSEGNVAVDASKLGDNSFYNETFVTTPGTNWKLTDIGVDQADETGRWLISQQLNFDQYLVSPYVRTRMTAAKLNLPAARWRLNRSLREREWGDLDSLTREEFKNRFPESYRNKKINPLYWCPPGGESVAEVAENRVRNILDTMHREYSHQNVIMVCHGETMRAWQLTVERWSDEAFKKIDSDNDRNLSNAGVIWYRKTNPNKPLNEVLEGAPVFDGKNWAFKVHRPWTRFKPINYTNDELWDTVKDYPSVLYPPIVKNNS